MKYLCLVITMMHPSKVKSINNFINVITYTPWADISYPPPENSLNKSFDWKGKAAVEFWPQEPPKEAISMRILQTTVLSYNVTAFQNSLPNIYFAIMQQILLITLSERRVHFWGSEETIWSVVLKLHSTTTCRETLSGPSLCVQPGTHKWLVSSLLMSIREAIVKLALPQELSLAFCSSTYL